MPEVDGIEFITQLRGERVRDKIKAISLSGYTGNVQRTAALSSGFDRYLNKPVEPQELVTAIAELGT